MNIPEGFYFTKNDEWIQVDGETGSIGITDYAQDQLSDIVYLEITVSAGDTLGQGDTVAAVESVKAASDIYSPVSGEVLEVNDPLADTPELINTDPYQEAWVLKLKLSDPDQLTALLNPEQYKAYIEEREA